MTKYVWNEDQSLLCFSYPCSKNWKENNLSTNISKLKKANIGVAYVRIFVFDMLSELPHSCQ
jgi:hypothetical protein